MINSICNFGFKINKNGHSDFDNLGGESLNEIFRLRHATGGLA